MKNQTLVFKKGEQTMQQKCGDNYIISKENVIAIMVKCGWVLVETIG